MAEIICKVCVIIYRDNWLKNFQALKLRKLNYSLSVDKIRTYCVDIE